MIIIIITLETKKQLSAATIRSFKEKKFVASESEIIPGIVKTFESFSVSSRKSSFFEFFITISLCVLSIYFIKS